MAIALIGSASGGSSSGTAVTSGSLNTTGANLIVVAANWYTGGGFTSLTDSKGNTWTPLTSRDSSGISSTRLYYCYNPTVGSGHTFTVTAGFPAVCVLAFSGAAASPFDVENGNGNTSGNLQPGSITPSLNNEVVVTSICGADASITINGGFSTPVFAPFGGGTNKSGGISYLIQTTAAAANPAWTSGASWNAAAIASFKAAVPVNVSPGKATLTLTTFAPVVTTPVNVSPGKATLTLTTFAPVVTTPVNVSPGKATLTLTTFAPVVTTPVNVSPGKATLTLTTFAPVVTTPVNVSPGKATLTLTTFAPVVTTPVNVSPGKATLTLTLFAPVVTTPASVTVIPGPATLTLTLYAPVVITAAPPAQAKFHIRLRMNPYYLLSLPMDPEFHLTLPTMQTSVKLRFIMSPYYLLSLPMDPEFHLTLPTMQTSVKLRFIMSPYYLLSLPMDPSLDIDIDN